MASAFNALPVPTDTVIVSMLAVATWFIVGTPVAIHFLSLDLPVPHAIFVGWSFGGLVTAFMYIATFCE